MSHALITDGKILKVLILTTEDSTTAGHDRPGKNKMETESLKEKIIKHLSGSSKQIKLKFSNLRNILKHEG